MSRGIVLEIDVPEDDEGPFGCRLIGSVQSDEVGTILMAAVDAIVYQAMLADIQDADPHMNGDLQNRLARLESRSHLSHVLVHLPGGHADGAELTL